MCTVDKITTEPKEFLCSLPKLQVKFTNSAIKNYLAEVLDCVLSSLISDWEWLGTIDGGDHWSGSMRK